MGKVRIITLIICVLSVLGMAPHILFSDYVRPTVSEKILHKRETISSDGEPKYYFILDESGSTLVTPKSYYSLDKGQDFNYFKGKEKSDQIAGFYALSLLFSLLLLLVFGFYKLITSDEFN